MVLINIKTKISKHRRYYNNFKINLCLYGFVNIFLKKGLKMELKDIVKYAMKALSYTNTKINVTKNYELERKVINAMHYHYRAPFYETWDHNIRNNDHNVPVRIFTPKKEDLKQDSKIIVFFHGGGWVTGNIDSYTKCCNDMSKYLGHIIASVDYRLAPEYPFPEGLMDCYQVAKTIILNSSILNTSPENIILMGDSAGGNLAAAVSMMARDTNEFKVSSQILLYPSTYNDHSDNSPFPSIRENGKDFILTAAKICDYMDLYVKNKEDFQSPYLAPLLAKNFNNLPNTLIITAQYDPLRDEGEAFGEKLLQAGNFTEIHRINDAIHGFFTMPAKFSKVQACYKIINDFLEKV